MIERKKALVAANIGMWVFQGLYTASPIDLIPDLLPLLGWFDDALGLLVTIAFTFYTISVIRKYGLAGLLPNRATESEAAAVIDANAEPVAIGTGSELAGYEPLTPAEIRAL